MNVLISSDAAATPFSHRLIKGVLALCLASGLVAVSAAPAHAAGSIAACFMPVKQVNGYAYPIAMNLTGLPVTVQALHDGTVYNVTPTPLKLHISGSHLGLPNGSSCITWNVPANLQQYPLRVVMNYSYSVGVYLANIKWAATTPWFAPAGNGTYYSVLNNAYCTQGC